MPANEELPDCYCNDFVLRLSKQVYHNNAVIAAAYKFTDRCSIDLQSEDDYTVVVLRTKDGVAASDLSTIAADLSNEALDQQLRLDLESRYGALREAIVKAAYDPVSSPGKKKLT